MARNIAYFGWRPDLPDARDYRYALRHPQAIPLPKSVDLRSLCPPVYDQGELGSCTGNAIAGALEFDAIKQGYVAAAPSRLFIYYNERVIEGDPQSDNGAEIRDGIKSVAQQGACAETTWPYDVAKFAQKPSTAAYAEALNDLALTYERIDNSDIGAIKDALASGLPVVFGFTVYESFESEAVASSGVVPMPADSEQVVGGHAVMCVGYDDNSSMFIVRNSWGADWGQAGYFTIPYAYLTNPNLADDFWVIQTVGR